MPLVYPNRAMRASGSFQGPGSRNRSAKTYAVAELFIASMKRVPYNPRIAARGIPGGQTPKRVQRRTFSGPFFFPKGGIGGEGRAELSRVGSHRLEGDG